MPLIAETMILVALAYLVGLGLGWLLARRKKRKSYLEWEDA
ncbi:LPXTG cell wall anchor domain-containing protein [Allosphingosinicella sp.]|jgi:LPXTG-motif cell wall-anchored protein